MRTLNVHIFEFFLSQAPRTALFIQHYRIGILMQQFYYNCQRKYPKISHVTRLSHVCTIFKYLPPNWHAIGKTFKLRLFNVAKKSNFREISSLEERNSSDISSLSSKNHNSLHELKHTLRMIIPYTINVETSQLLYYCIQDPTSPNMNELLQQF